MSVSIAAARASIYARLSAAVGSVANVHDYTRMVTDEATRDVVCKKGGLFSFWYVSLADDNPFLTVNSRRIEGRNPINNEFGLYNFSLHGFYGWNDANATEKTFADIVESVVTAFRNDKKLGETVIDSGPIQWHDGKPRMYPPGEGGVLCHYGRLDISVFVQTEP